MLHGPISLTRTHFEALSLRLVLPLTLLAGVSSAQTFGPETVVTTTADGASCVVPGDIDGNGTVDLVITENDGNRVTWIPQLVGGGYGPANVIDANLPKAWRALCADLDGDQDLDVVVGGYSKDTLAWYENGGDGSTWTKHLEPISLSSVVGMTLSDTDMDGDMDLLATCSLDGKVVRLENLNESGFGPQHLITSAVNQAWAIQAADINADGAPDIFVSGLAMYQLDSLNMLLNNGDGTFGKVVVIASAVLGISSIEPCDLDGDGDLDLLVPMRSKNSIAWFENDGTGMFGAYQHIATVLIPERVRVADIDKDGDLDLFASSQFSNTFLWYEGLGGAKFGPQITLNDKADGAGYFSLVDLNGDNLIDVVGASNKDDTVGAYTNMLAQPPSVTGITGLHSLDPGLVWITGENLEFATVEVSGDPVAIVSATPTELIIQINPCAPGGLCDVELTSSEGTTFLADALPRYPVVVCAPTVPLGQPIEIDLDNGDAGVYVLAVSPTLFATPALFPGQDWYYGLELNGVWILESGAFSPGATEHTVTLPGIAASEFIGVPFHFQAWMYQSSLNYAGFSGIATGAITAK